MRTLVAALIWTCLACAQPQPGPQQPDTQWPHYGGAAGGTRYAPAAQITPENVDRLEIAWQYRTGALDQPSRLDEKAAFEATPIHVNGRLLLSTPFNQVIALDPQTGRELWKFDPQIDRDQGYSEVASRGVSYRLDPDADLDADPGQPCAETVYAGTLDARLIALDARTGRPCKDFGGNGTVNLQDGIEIKDRGDYQTTSPPAVVGDLVIVGSSIGDNRRVRVEQGTVRAFDARTGKQRWSWDPIPATLNAGAANAWAPLAFDEARDLVFIPTGSPSPDYYGGLRQGDNRDANSVVALRASTGERVWAFQVVHHDLWDYDVASQPALVEVDGRAAVAVNTKMGHLFLLDRETGEPIWEVEEREVPASNVEGEQAAETQPFPANPALAPSSISADDAWGPTDADREHCRERIASLDREGIFTPPSVRGAIVYPGNVGGVNWGSAAVDPARNLLFVLTNRLPLEVRLIPRDRFEEERKQGRDNRLTGEFARQQGAPYGMYRTLILGPSGAPCIAPSWGMLSAVDLHTGEIRWESPAGEMRLGEQSVPGAPALGGPMVTASGLVFFSATRHDDRLHVHDAETGEPLAHFPLPAGGQATPMSYVGQDGRQYVVIAAGGHGKAETTLGDHVIAFALPPR